MKKLILIILKNLYYIPFAWLKLSYFAKHVERYPEQKRYSFIRKIVKRTINSGKIIVNVYGEEYIPQEDGYIILSNHQGLFDGFAIVQAMDKPFSTVFKKELGNVPFLKQILSCAEAISLDRDDIRQGLEVINKVAEEVKKGRNFMIFPEGTRSKNGNELLDFKGGSLKGAIKAKCPILPIALIDSYKVFDNNSFGKATVQVHIMRPLQYEEYRDMSASQIANVVKASIEETIKIHISLAK
jgi:1-acyl-sn-glycerol-3-phosphate acyltransferase